MRLMKDLGMVNENGGVAYEQEQLWRQNRKDIVESRCGKRVKTSKDCGSPVAQPLVIVVVRTVTTPQRPPFVIGRLQLRETTIFWKQDPFISVVQVLQSRTCRL